MLIQRLHWGLASPEAIEKCAACVVRVARVDCGVRDPTLELHQQTWFETPADRRMGPAVRGERCETCGGEYMQCRGHFGCIKLAGAVLLPHLAPHVKRALETVCVFTDTCSGVFASGHEKSCPKCGAPRPARVSMTKTHVMVRWPEDKEAAADGASWFTRMWTMAQVAAVLRCKPDDVWRSVDTTQAHPAWCVWTHLPVLPLTARPYRFTTSGSRMPDPTTAAYKRVLECNLAVSESVNDPAFVGFGHQEALHDAVVQLVLGPRRHMMPGERSTESARIMRRITGFASNAVTHALSAGSKRRANAAEQHRSIASRLAGKHGRIRGTLLGNRGDGNFRAVITGTDELALDEVGVPNELARRVTSPVAVTRANLREIRTELLLREDVDDLDCDFEWPGSTQKDDRMRVVFEPERNMVWAGPLRSTKHTVTHGYVVKRATINGAVYEVSSKNIKAVAASLKVGDVVHRRLVNGDVVLLNRQPTLHAGSIMAMRVRIVRGSSIKFRGELASSFNADFDGDEMNVFVPQTESARAEAVELMGVAQNLMTGQPGLPNIGVMQNALLAAYLMTSEGVWLDRATTCDVLVRGGFGPDDLREPTLPEQDKWSGRDVLSHAFPRGFDWDGPDGASVRNGVLVKGRLGKAALAQTPNGIVEHLAKHKSPEAALRFLNAFQPMVGAWLALRGFTVAKRDVSLADGGRAISEHVERARMAIDAEARAGGVPEAELRMFWSDRCGALYRDLEKRTLAALRAENPENAVLAMVAAGSKGKEVNAVQMAGALGLQTLKGHMMRCSGGRLLPMFPWDETNTMRGVGFVSANFSKGLSLSDALVHARSGRAGVVDTALQTPKAGHLARSIKETLQSVVVAYDGTVRRTATNDVVQYAYGGLGLAPEKLWRVPLTQRCGALTNDQDEVEFEAKRVLALAAARETTSPVYDVQVAPNEFDDGMDVRATQEDVREARDGAVRQMAAHMRVASSSSTAEMVRRCGAPAAALVSALRPTVLGGAPLYAVREAAKNAVDAVRRALVEPGTAVGTQAALGASHAATQSTMNTFKLAGQMQAGKRELERTWEILGMAKTQQDTLVTLHLDDGSADADAVDVASKLRLRPLAHFTLAMRVVGSEEEKPEWEVRFDASRDEESGRRRGGPSAAASASVAPWAVELVFSKVRMDRHGVGLHNLVSAATLGIPACVRTSHTNPAGWDSAPPTMRAYLSASRVLKPMTAYAAGANAVSASTVSGCALFRGEVDADPAARVVRALAQPQRAADALRWTWRLTTSGVLHRVTECTHIQTVYRVYGVQAARNAVIKELRNAIGGDVSTVHIALLADALTRDGSPRSIKSSGAASKHTTVAAHAAYDQELKRFVSGAVRGATDRVVDVPSARIVGATVPLGTGGPFKLLLDEHQLREYCKEEPQQEDAEATPYMHTQALDRDGDLRPFSPAFSTAAFSPVAAHNAYAGLDGNEDEVLYSPSTPAYAPVLYSPSSPTYSPSSPAQAATGAAAVLYSPSTPAYSPSSPATAAAPVAPDEDVLYSPSSPTYEPRARAHAPAHAPAWTTR